MITAIMVFIGVVCVVSGIELGFMAVECQYPVQIPQAVYFAITSVVISTIGVLALWVAICQNYR